MLREVLNRVILIHPGDFHWTVFPLCPWSTFQVQLFVSICCLSISYKRSLPFLSFSSPITEMIYFLFPERCIFICSDFFFTYLSGLVHCNFLPSIYQWLSYFDPIIQYLICKSWLFYSAWFLSCSIHVISNIMISFYFKQVNQTGLCRCSIFSLSFLESNTSRLFSFSCSFK